MLIKKLNQIRLVPAKKRFLDPIEKKGVVPFFWRWKSFLGFAVLLVMIFPSTSRISNIPPQKNILAIEKKLFELVNKEREKQGLASLRLSPELTVVARKHSQDMASYLNKEPSHFSSTGKDYTDRLLEAGFYFRKNGENVAFSESYAAEVTHEGFMKSPGHRENILDPEFDELGVGVIFEENEGYYITEDFLLSFVPMEEEEVKKEIQEKINDLRAKSSLPPLSFLAEADDYAKRYARSKAEGKPAPPIPQNFRGMLLIYTSSPFLEDAMKAYKEKVLGKIYESAGFSAHFSRDKKNPGGFYAFALLLFPENKYRSWSQETLKQAIFSNLNKIRETSGLTFFKWDEELAAQADRVAEQLFSPRSNIPAILAIMPGVAILRFITEDPTLLPSQTKEKIENNLRNFVQAGVGIYFGKNQEFRGGAFWVVILLRK